MNEEDKDLILRGLSTIKGLEEFEASRLEEMFRRMGVVGNKWAKQARERAREIDDLIERVKKGEV